MIAERRVRRTLTEADWSLPARSSTPVQLRRAAARRMRVLGTATIAAIAALTAGIVVPLSAAGGRATSAAHHGHHARSAHPLPPLGAPGFPVAVYPAPGRMPRSGKAPCPSLRGVDRQPPPTDKAAYRELARDFGGQSFTHDLQRADRSMWPRLRHAYSHLQEVSGAVANGAVPIGRLHIEGIRPLRLSNDGPSAAFDCGGALVRRSDEIRYDSAPGDIDDAYVLQRGGHLLLWGPTRFVSDMGADPYEGGTSQRYVHRHPPQCGNVFSGFTVNRSGRAPSVTFVAHTPPLYFRCSLTGWANVTLATLGRSPVHARHVGSAHQVILQPGQSATATLQVRPCSGPTATYHSAFVTVDHNRSVQNLVSIRIGSCGVDIGPITKR